MTTLTDQPKNRKIAASGGSVFFGWLFLFTVSVAGSGPMLTDAAKHSASITNQAKH